MVARLQAREAVSLAVATITSSASLILLALLFTEKEELPVLVIVLGILFPLLGLIYIETTYRGIHTHDHEWIRRLVAEESNHIKESRKKNETEDILRYTKHRIVKFVLIRFILSTPIFGWFFIIDELLESNYVIGMIASIISIGIILELYRRDKIKDLPDNNDVKGTK